MTTPALQRLRERYPDACIALLTPGKFAELWLEHPAINKTLSFAPGENPWAIARRLWPEQFDTAIVLPNSPRSALEPWLARIPTRLGYARPWRNWFLTQAIPPRPGRQPMRKRPMSQIRRLTTAQRPPSPAAPRKQDAAAHQSHEYLHLVAALGANPTPVAPQLFVSASEIQAALLRFKLPLPPLSGSGTPLLALNPGAEYGPAKRWPVESFIAAATQIQQRTNCTWLVIGGKPDLPIGTTICSALSKDRSARSASGPGAPHAACLNLAGLTSLRELMAILTLCRVLLTNDTGPMHVAAALGTPVVVPFGSTSPELTGPGLPGDPRHQLLQAHVPCAPCFRRSCPIDFRCMRSLNPDRVTAAVLAAL